jgi:predicted amidophosphoribosyltransferase
MAVKGCPIGGFAQIPSRGQIHRVDAGSLDCALRLFGEMIADVASSEEGLMRPLVLIPVPNSRCDVRSIRPPRTCAQAEALARELGSGASIWDGLRWVEPLISARRVGGTRDPQALFDRLVAIMALPAQATRVVFVDDVLATGGHLQACAAVIRSHGREADLAAVAGRSDPRPAGDPFAIRVDMLEDFKPRGSHVP